MLKSTEGSSAAYSASLKVGSKCIIAQDTDIRGSVQLGDGVIIHPKASIQALSEDGKIVIGSECIIEELTHIVHRGPGVMTIGDKNLFEVGCYIESPSIGSHNIFECKSRVLANVTIPDFCTVGTACVAQPPIDWEMETEENVPLTPSATYCFPPRTVLYGEQSLQRQWSGNGVRQADALHMKHLDHLRKNLPEFHQLRIIR